MIDVKNLKLVLLGALAVLVISNIGCSKSNNSSSSTQDSIRYSTWVSLNMQQQVDNSNDTFFIESLKAASLTKDLLSRSTVIGYLEVQDPLSGDTSIVNAALAFEEFYLVGSISMISGVDYSGFRYRYVIVPGKIHVTNANGGVMNYSAAQLKEMDYATLTKLLNIPTRGSNFVNPNQ
jgi:hypothetical protein